jgi:hypothetical protein
LNGGREKFAGVIAGSFVQNAIDSLYQIVEKYDEHRDSIVFLQYGR